MSARTVFGDITLPDGRIVTAQIKGIDDSGNSAFIETSFTLEWKDGYELTISEQNERIGENYFLHEWVAEQLYEYGTWENDHPEPID